jgi:hypothetical protein
LVNLDALIIRIVELGSDQVKGCYVNILSLKRGCFEALNACFWRLKGQFKKRGGEEGKGGANRS